MTGPSDVAADKDSGVARTDAARVAAHLEAIRRVLRDAAWAEARRHSISVTAPQLHALQILVEHLRDTGSGLSLSDLSQRMGLAHSTVSGIVSRLEARNLLQRTTPPDDRRFSLIELTTPAMEWVEHDLPASRRSPLAAGLAKASAEERTAILDGLAALERLLAGGSAQAGLKRRSAGRT
ncbi:MAG TPA: MarR family transcriptional regulator [Pseudonocardiaceae bacterium]|nr:MarR family transcriptional regulator [Pseudonocardiaceae bacterium]